MIRHAPKYASAFRVGDEVGSGCQNAVAQQVIMWLFVMVIIHHALYAPRKILVEPGQKVKRSDRIALPGNADVPARPHLHYGSMDKPAGHEARWQNCRVPKG